MSFRQRLLVSLKRLPSNVNMSTAATVTVENMNPCIKKMEYAVRGPLVIRATAIEKVGREGFFSCLSISELLEAKIYPVHED